ncbi:MAG: neutral trehalase [Acidimicrobiia bacterium]
MTDDLTLRAHALEVLRRNRRDGYTVPALGLYPYQWCWDTGPIALGWAAASDWEQAWTEIDSLCSAQWENGFVPHIVFWQECDDYFPGPEVWDAHRRDGSSPATTGLTQPPLPVSAAATLLRTDPDRERARERITRLWPRLVAWLEWIGRARRGPHGAAVIVHPWESGMDNSPAWDEPLASTPQSTSEHLDRRDVQTVAAAQRPSTVEYRHYLGIVAALRDAGWDTERQPDDSPFVVEDPGFTAIAARAADDLATIASALGEPDARFLALATTWRVGLESLWDDELRWYRAHDVRASRAIGPRTAGGLLASWADADSQRSAEMAACVDSWRGEVPFAVPTTDPSAAGFDPVRYWRGPAWVLVNWMIADGERRAGRSERADALRALTRTLVERHGFCEYFDPRDGKGIGGVGFSWSAALTLAWLTDSD